MFKKKDMLATVSHGGEIENNPKLKNEKYSLFVLWGLFVFLVVFGCFLGAFVFEKVFRSRCSLLKLMVYPGVNVHTNHGVPWSKRLVVDWVFSPFQEQIHLYSKFPASHIGLRECLCGKLQLSQIKLFTRVCSVFLLVFSCYIMLYIDIWRFSLATFFISPSIIPLPASKRVSNSS